MKTGNLWDLIAEWRRLADEADETKSYSRGRMYAYRKAASDLEKLLTDGEGKA